MSALLLRGSNEQQRVRACRHVQRAVHFRNAPPPASRLPAHDDVNCALYALTKATCSSVSGDLDLLSFRVSKALWTRKSASSALIPKLRTRNEAPTRPARPRPPQQCR